MEMCKGKYEVAPDPAHLAVPRPDLVCVGSRGQKFLKRLVLGSVSSAVLSNAAAPTCIYRSNLPPPTPSEIATRKKLGPDAARGEQQRLFQSHTQLFEVSSITKLNYCL